MNNAEILYESNSLISLMINDELYEISKEDPRFRDIKANISNPKKLNDILSYSLDGLSKELFQKITENQSVDISILKNIYLNLSKKEKMSIDNILKLMESRKIIPLDSNGFYFLSNTKNAQSNLEIPVSTMVFNIFKNTNHCILKEYFPTISNKQQTEISEIIKQKPVLLLNIALKLEDNPDKLKSILSHEIFLGNNLSTKNISFIIDFFNKMYEGKKERIFNQLKNNTSDFLSESFVSKAKTLISKDLIHPKKFNNTQELYNLVLTEYSKNSNLIEYQGLSEKHPILFNLLNNDDLKDYTFIVPSKSDVIKWGNLFNNCYATRNKAYINGKILLFGLKCRRTENLEYVGEFNYNQNSVGDFETYNKKQNASLKKEVEITINQLIKEQFEEKE